MLTGTNDQNADGSVSITIYRGSKQYSGADQGKTMGEYIRTVFAHDSKEAIGGSHAEAEQHEIP